MLSSRHWAAAGRGPQFAACAPSPAPHAPAQLPTFSRPTWPTAAMSRQQSGNNGGNGGGNNGGAASDAAAQEALMQRVLKALRADPEYKQGSVYRCRNGHVYLVGGCTNPAGSATCPACGAHIGFGSGDSRVSGM